MGASVEMLDRGRILDLNSIIGPNRPLFLTDPKGDLSAWNRFLEQNGYEVRVYDFDAKLPNGSLLPK